MRRLRIGISSCLMGNRVRYDGHAKRASDINSLLQQQVELIPICPEVAIGLGIPRPPIQLCDSLTHPKAQQVDNPDVDVTYSLHSFGQQIAMEFDLHGYIFKSRSPSCGLKSTPVYINHNQQNTMVSGIFTQSVADNLPGLPVIEESVINSNSGMEIFIEQCKKYQKLGVWIDTYRLTD